MKPLDVESPLMKLSRGGKQNKKDVGSIFCGVFFSFSPRFSPSFGFSYVLSVETM